MNITIQKISEKDWEDYKNIRLESLQLEPQAYRTTYAEALEYTKADWQKYTTTAIILIAKDNAKPIGIVGAYYKTENNNTYAIVIGVYLNPAYREKGIGKQMLEAVIQEVINEGKVNAIRLWVNQEQQAAVKLYTNAGFTVIGEDSITLGDGKQHPELIMEKKIS